MSAAITTGALRIAGPVSRAERDRDRAEEQRGSAERELAWQRAIEQAGCEAWAHGHRPVEAAHAAEGAPELPAARAPATSGGGPRSGAGSRRLPAAAGRAPAAGDALAPPIARTIEPDLRALAAAPARSPEVAALAARTPGANPGNAPARTVALAADTPLPHGTPLPHVVLNPAAALTPFGPLDPEAPSLPSSRPVGASAPPANQDRAPLRVHAEWSELGVRVWLGADRGASLAVARAAEPLLAALRRRAATRGGSLLTVVCNGRTLYDAQAGAAGSPPTGPHDDTTEVPAASSDHPEDVP